MDYDHKIELERLIKEDILSKKDDMSLDEFLEDYFSDDLMDYQNATGLNLIFDVEKHDDDFEVKVSLV